MFVLVGDEPVLGGVCCLFCYFFRFLGVFYVIGSSVASPPGGQGSDVLPPLPTKYEIGGFVFYEGVTY